MDAVYIYRTSPFEDIEIRYSLRSIAKFAPYIRKVWIFGDKPDFISDDLSLIQHVPHEYTARILQVETPVRNFGLLMVLASLIPELSFEYLQFSDDHILLKDYPIEMARKTRFHCDMAMEVPPPTREIGYWKRTLWNTVDTLLRLGHNAFNFETHTPRRLTRKMVFEAYSELKEFFTEHRAFGLTGPTAILNHGYSNECLDLTSLSEEGEFSGFWHAQPDYEEVCTQSEGKTFLNFDDKAFGDGIQRYLAEKFPDPSKYEKMTLNNAKLSDYSRLTLCA